MNRSTTLGIAMFIAIAGLLALVAPQSAVAGHGCGAVGVGVARGGWCGPRIFGWRRCGHVAHHGCAPACGPGAIGVPGAPPLGPDAAPLGPDAVPEAPVPEPAAAVTPPADPLAVEAPPEDADEPAAAEAPDVDEPAAVEASADDESDVQPPTAEASDEDEPAVEAPPIAEPTPIQDVRLQRSRSVLRRVSFRR